MSTITEETVAQEPDERPSVRKRLTSHTGLRAVLIPVLAGITWEAVAQLGLLSSSLFPPLSKVLQVLFDWVTGTTGAAAIYSGTWHTHVGASATRVLTGFALGSLLAIILGFLVGRSKLWRGLFDPLIQGLRPVPITAWVPLAVIWFGIGYKPAIFLVTLGAFFPVYVNTVHAVAHVNDNLVRAGRMLGADKRRILTRVIAPAALPVVAAGMRVGLGFAWMCVIVSEMLAVKSGIGYVLWDSYYYANISMVVAAMITIGLLGYISDRIMRFALDHYTAWAEQETA